MTAQDWTRIEGMIISARAGPQRRRRRTERNSAILTQIEWFPSSPQLLGLNVAVADERVFTIPLGRDDNGPTPAGLADNSPFSSNRSPHQYASTDHLRGRFAWVRWPSEEKRPGHRGKTHASLRLANTASSVPLLARRRRPRGRKACRRSPRAPRGAARRRKAGTSATCRSSPIRHRQRVPFLVTDDHLSTSWSHNWGMDAAIVLRRPDKGPGPARRDHRPGGRLASTWPIARRPCPVRR